MFVEPVSVIGRARARRARRARSQGSTGGGARQKGAAVATALAAAFAAGLAGAPRDARAEGPSSPRAALPPDVLPLAAVKPGMKGWGLTVAKGLVPERFEAEVIDVLAHYAPGRSAILVRLSGLGLENAGIVAGMSGSPLYLDGKIAGAVAAGWGFSKEPIGLVTPIEEMLGIEAAIGAPRPPAARSGAEGRAAFRRLALAEAPPDAATLDRERAGLLPPPRTSSGPSLLAGYASGFPEASTSRFREVFDRIGVAFPASGAGTSGVGVAAPPSPAPVSEPSPSSALVPGSSIGALLVDGDLRLAATGTVTYVHPDGRFLAFGHPFLGAGPVDLPVAPARVATMFASSYVSFKIATPLAAEHRLVADREPAVAGRSRERADMLPVTLRVSVGGAERVWRYAVARIPRLLGALVAFTSDAALTSVDPTSRVETVRYRLRFTTAAATFDYRDVSTGARARETALLTAVLLANTVVDNEWEDPKLSGVEMSFDLEEGEDRRRIVTAALAKRKAAPGEVVPVTVRLSERRGPEEVRVLSLRVPEDAPEGRLAVLVGDGRAISLTKASMDPSEPRTLAEYARFVSRLVPSNAVGALLLAPSRGTVAGSDAIPSLPGTLATLLEGDRGPAVNQRLLAETVAPLEEPVAGAVRLELEIERPLLR